MKQRKNTLLIVTSIALIVGFLSGLGGVVFSRYYLNRLSFLSDLYLPSDGGVGQREVVIQDVNRVIVEQDDRVTQVLDKAKSALFGVYRNKSLTATGIEAYYLPQDALGQAIALTSDGWLVARLTQNYQPNALVIAQGSKVYTVSQIQRDVYTGLSYIKVEAQNLPVLEFATLESLGNGQSVVSYDVFTQSTQVTRIEDVMHRTIVNRFDVVQSVEEYDIRILLENAIESGRPILNLNGNLVGVSLGEGIVIKDVYIKFALNSLLRNEVITLPTLGINFVSVHDIAGYAQGVTEGVIVVPNINGVAVSTQSPLFEQVQVGDVIVSIEDTRLTHANNFMDLLYDYKLGDTVTLGIVRGGEQLSVEYQIQ
jgi:hypothetical protein